MPYSTFLFITIVCVLFCGCAKSPPTAPPGGCDDNICDTCDTYAPLSPYDSLHSLPRSLYTISKVEYNQARGAYIGLVEKLGHPSFSGIFVLHHSTFTTEIIPGWSFCLFSDGQRMIIELPGWQGLALYDFRTKVTMRFPNLRTEFGFPSLSIDEKFIIADSAHRTFRIGIDGSWREALTDSLVEPVQLDQQHLIGITRMSIPRYGIRTLDLDSKKLEWIDFSGLPDDMNWGFSHHTLALSPDRTKLLMDVASVKGNMYRENGGVYILDLKTRTARNVLKRQYWIQQYLPTWSSNSTFYASYYCRKDSSAMLYEYDLNGKVLRQVTFKGMKLYP